MLLVFGKRLNKLLEEEKRKKRSARRRRPHLSIPSSVQVVFNSEYVQSLSHDMVNQIIDFFRPVIEAGCSRENCYPCLGQMVHVPELDRIERSFTGNKNKRTPFFQGTVCSTKKEIVCKARGNSGYGLHAAGNDNHSQAIISATGKGRGEIKTVMATGCKPDHIIFVPCSLNPDHLSGHVCHDKVGFDAEIPDSFKHPDAVHNSTCTG